MEEQTKEERQKKLKEFGLVMTLALSVLGGVFVWKESVICLYLFTPAAIFLLLAVFAPDVLDPVERGWMKFAEKLSVVTTYIVVAITFYLVVTPTALLMRLLRKDLLSLKFEPEKESYWVPVEEDAPGTRPYLPY